MGGQDRAKFLIARDTACLRAPTCGENTRNVLKDIRQHGAQRFAAQLTWRRHCGRPAYAIGLSQPLCDRPISLKRSLNLGPTQTCESKSYVTHDNGPHSLENLGTVGGPFRMQKWPAEAGRPFFLSDSFSTTSRAGDRARTGDVQLGKLSETNRTIS
jgi:hypothetical protein